MVSEEESRRAPKDERKKPERAGNRGNRYVAREGLGCRLPFIDDYIISYEKEKFRSQMLNRILNID